jgi:hypothetical protein
MQDGLQLFGKIHDLDIRGKGHLSYIRNSIQLEQNIRAGNDHYDNNDTETEHHLFINSQLHNY